MTTYVDQPNWSQAMYAVVDELARSSDFDRFEQCLMRDQSLCSRMNTMVGTCMQTRLMTSLEFFRLLLSTTVRMGGDELPRDRVCFDEAWNRATESLLAESVEVRHWCIVENVELPSDKVELLPGFFVRGLNASDVETLWSNSRMMQAYYPGGQWVCPSVLGVRALLETMSEVRVVVGDGKMDSTEFPMRREKVRSTFDTIGNLIRLVCPHRVTILPIVTEVQDVWESSSAGIRYEHSNILAPNTSILSEQDVREMKKMVGFALAGDSGLRKSADTCLRRIGFANGRISAEDRLLDTMMALEALVLAEFGDPSVRGELSFRLAVCLARFLGAGEDERRAVYKLVKDAYKARSKIIHGGEMSPQQLRRVDELSVLARSAIKKYLLLQADGEMVDWMRLALE